MGREISQPKHLKIYLAYGLRTLRGLFAFTLRIIDGAEFVLRIIEGAEFVLRIEGGSVAAADPFESRCICRLISSGDGIPGVGVAPGFIFTFTFAGSGIPGVGVAPGRTVLAPVPITVLPFIMIGLLEIPAGRFEPLRFTGPTPTMFTPFAMFAFESTVEPQPESTPNVAARSVKSAMYLIIKSSY